MSRVLIVANDVVGSRMAGPGIRCIELGQQLRRAGHDVTIAVGGGVGAFDSPGLALAPTGSVVEMDRLAAHQDVIVVQGFSLRDFPSLATAGPPLVADLYDPFPLALLEQERHLPISVRRARNREVGRILDQLLSRCDFFICASDRQRDLWLGALTAAGRVNPDTWAADSSLRTLIDIVPFGVPDQPPPPSTGRPSGFPEAIGPDDLVVMWGGGIYNWFDPLTLIRALATAVRSHGELKLVFMATGHPNPRVPEQMWMPGRARQLAVELGLEGRHVFFNQEWVPYQTRHAWLAASTCGVSTHFDHAETRYSFRTRILDYLWAGLPIIATEGDVLSELVRSEGLGWTVPAGQIEPLAAALEEMAGEPQLRLQMGERVRAVAARMTWADAARPLERFCADPRPAADLPGSRLRRPGPRSSAALRLGRLGRLARSGASSLRQEGLAATVRRGRAWLERATRR